MKEFLDHHWDEILVWIGVAMIAFDLYRNGWWWVSLGLVVSFIGAAHIIRSIIGGIRLKQRDREDN